METRDGGAERVLALGLCYLSASCETKFARTCSSDSCVSHEALRTHARTPPSGMPTFAGRVPTFGFRPRRSYVLRAFLSHIDLIEITLRDQTPLSCAPSCASESCSKQVGTKIS